MNASRVGRPGAENTIVNVLERDGSVHLEEGKDREYFIARSLFHTKTKTSHDAALDTLEKQEFGSEDIGSV